jgi:Family of unknown function (DUF6252)
MRKFILLLVSVIAITSCEKSVEFNNPALQGLVDGVIWKATSVSATKSASGAIKIVGSSPSGVIEFNVNSSALGTRILGTTNVLALASYTSLVDNFTFDYTTDIAPGPVNKLTLFAGGTGYTTASLVPTTGGSGNGLKVDYVAGAGGSVTTFNVNSPGNFYKAGDQVTITGGGANATFLVQNVSNSNGELTITEYDGVTISGTFKFIAYDALATPKTVVCREGVFYKVPVN